MPPNRIEPLPLSPSKSLSNGPTDEKFAQTLVLQHFFDDPSSVVQISITAFESVESMGPECFRTVTLETTAETDD